MTYWVRSTLGLIVIAVGSLLVTGVIRQSIVHPKPFQHSTKVTQACQLWGVVTTIFGPTPAILQFAQDLPGTCLAVVGDRKTELSLWTSQELPANIIFLTTEVQEGLGYALVKMLPWNHFGRKNIGFLYAIQQGAKWIYDFDDDNKLKPSTIPFFTSLMSQTTPMLSSARHFLFNPYPSFRPGEDRVVWPRGFPLNYIKDTSTTHLLSEQTAHSSVAVFQSVADHDPDVDAIYRMTCELPLTFSRQNTVVAVSAGTYSPWNAQAVLVHRSAFFGLVLPVTVTGRVSDIWRSYITSRLLWEAGHTVAFCSPFVDQYRNPHDYQRDFEEEGDLYLKALALIRAIDAFDTSRHTELSTVYLDLVDSLVQQGFLGHNDYNLARAWVADLSSVGYVWPTMKQTQFPRYPMNVSHVVDGRRLAVQPKTFWTSDLHDGTRIDVPSTLMSMGHRFLNMGHKRLGGPYPQYIRAMMQPTNPLSPLLDQLTTHSTPLSRQAVRDFYEYYKADVDMQRTDAFWCHFPASFCEIYMPFNRTILMAPAHRFLLGRCSSEESAQLIVNMHRLLEPSEKRPPSFIFGQGVYDVEYVKYFTGIDAPLLSSHSLTYTAGNVYCNGACRPEILVGPLQMLDNPNIARMNQAAEGQWLFVGVKTLYKHFELQDISNHRAMVLLPYAVLSYGITEVYALGVPLFVPSIRFLVDLGLLTDKNTNSPSYCGPGFVPPPQHPSSLHPFSPEDPSREAQTYWAQFADIYQWPHITTFESWQHLAKLLDAADFGGIHARVVAHNAVRMRDITKTLEVTTAQIQTGRIIPPTWEQAEALWT